LAASSSGSAPASTSEGGAVGVSHTDEPIREPLTKNLPEEFAKDATKMFIMVMKYMGDYPSKKGVDAYKLMHKVSFRRLNNIIINVSRCPNESLL
jgi:hypothetical protein